MKKIISCPRCGQDSEYSSLNPSRPFCSERCRLIDLGAWATEEYRIWGQSADESVNENPARASEGFETPEKEPF